jgi:hypothetical protein
MGVSKAGIAAFDQYGSDHTREVWGLAIEVEVRGKKRGKKTRNVAPYE